MLQLSLFLLRKEEREVQGKESRFLGAWLCHLESCLGATRLALIEKAGSSVYVLGILTVTYAFALEAVHMLLHVCLVFAWIRPTGSSMSVSL